MPSPAASVLSHRTDVTASTVTPGELPSASASAPAAVAPSSVSSTSSFFASSSFMAPFHHRLQSDSPARYSSFPSAQPSPQSPPSTAGGASTAGMSSIAPSLLSTQLMLSQSQPPPPPPPPQPFPFSHNDTDKSRHAYENLAACAKAYRVALGQLSTAASNFGAALESCARLKEARAPPLPGLGLGLGLGGMGLGGGVGGSNMLDSGFLNGGAPPSVGGLASASASTVGGIGSSMAGSGFNPPAPFTADILMATSGLYYLMANQQGILAETVYRSFELPTVHELDRYCADVEAEKESYAAGMRDASRDIRRLEKEGVKLRKPRQRDVGRMRSHLVAMTAALDALTARQAAHAVALLDQSRDMSATVSQASRNLVRAEMDILDGLARKGWPGGGLDGVLDGAVDLFSRGSYDDDVLVSVSGGGGGGDDLGIAGLTAARPVSSGLTRTGLAALGGSIHSHSHSRSRSPSANGNGIGRNGGSSSATPTDKNSSRLFSILPSGTILGDNDDDDIDDDATPPERRGRSHSTKSVHDDKNQDDFHNVNNGSDNMGGRIMSSDSNNNIDNDNDDSTTLSSSPDLSQTMRRRDRADSLSVSPAGVAYAYRQTRQNHQYQSLNSVAVADGDGDGNVHSKSKSTSKSKSKTRSQTSRSRPRARPFSPQRVLVDPRDDIFTGKEAARAPVTPTEADAEANGDNNDTKNTRDTDEETDEGVHAWRQESDSP